MSQNIADRLFLLGEDPLIHKKGLRADEAGNFPPYLKFWARNTTKEEQNKLLHEAIANHEWDKIPYGGSRPFLATAEEWAEYSNPTFAQDKKKLKDKQDETFQHEWKKALNDPKNSAKLKTEKGRKELQSEIQYYVSQMYRPFNAKELGIADQAGKKLGRNIDIFYGSKPIFNDFMQKREAIFQQKDNDGHTGKHNIAKNNQAENIQDMIKKGSNPFLTGKLGKTVDLKRELYRPIEQFLTNLGFFHQCKSQNCIDIAHELITRGILSPDLGNKMINCFNVLTGLKLKEQRTLKRQGKALYLNQDKFNEEKKDLEDKIQTLKNTITFMENLPQGNAIEPALSCKKRELITLESDLECLLEMAPGKILSPEDILTLEKTLPLLQEILNASREWVEGKNKLGFKNELLTAFNHNPLEKKLYKFINNCDLIGLSNCISKTNEKFNVDTACKGYKDSILNHAIKKYATLCNGKSLDQKENMEKIIKLLIMNCSVDLNNPKRVKISQDGQTSLMTHDGKDSLNALYLAADLNLPEIASMLVSKIVGVYSDVSNNCKGLQGLFKDSIRFGKHSLTAGLLSGDFKQKNSFETLSSQTILEIVNEGCPLDYMCQLLCKVNNDSASVAINRILDGTLTNGTKPLLNDVIQGRNGSSALTEAIKSGNVKAALKLLEVGGLKMVTQPIAGVYPLQLADNVGCTAIQNAIVKICKNNKLSTADFNNMITKKKQVQKNKM